MSNFKSALKAIRSIDVNSIVVEAYGEHEVFKLAEAIAHEGQINNFDGEYVSKWILSHGDRISRVRFGREYSPVLYITPSFDSHKTKAKRDKLAKDLVEAGDIMLAADESNIVNDRTLETRFWWD